MTRWELAVLCLGTALLIFAASAQAEGLGVSASTPEIKLAYGGQ